MYRFLVRPKWILFHLLIFGLAAVMVNLAFWQLRRLDERRAFNALVTSNSEQAVSPWSEVYSSGMDPDAQREVEWRPVSVTGTYRTDLALTIVNRAQDGTAGVDSLVPLEVADNSYVLVNRGFVPLALAVPAPPRGKITVTGYIRRTQKRGFGGAIDASTGTITELHRIDIPRIQKQMTGTVADMYVQRVESSPSEGEWPARVTMPKLDEGPHLSYAFQWFFFSLCAITGWVFVVRKKVAQNRGALSVPGSASEPLAD